MFWEIKNVSFHYSKVRIYKPCMRTIFMAKKQLQQQVRRKMCFGTKEWSENSGICNRCESKKECGEINAKKRQ